MKIYADIFFIINLSMDTLIFLAVSLIMRAEKSVSRFFLGGLITSAFQIGQLYFSGNAFFSTFLYLVTVFIACLAVFPHMKMWRAVTASALFACVSAISSGVLTCFYKSLHDTLPKYPENEGSGGIIPLAVCLMAYILSLALKMLTGSVKRIFKRVKKKKGSLKRDFKVCTGDKCVEIRGYCDSGNLLREPFGHLPVIITGKSVMENILPEGLHSVFFSSKKDCSATLTDARRVRIIPIMPLGGGGAHIMLGYLPDRIFVGEKEVSACIALDCANEIFGGCEALLPSEFMNI